MSKRTKIIVWVIIAIVVIGIIIAVVHNFSGTNNPQDQTGSTNTTDTSSTPSGAALSSTGENSVASAEIKKSTSSAPVSTAPNPTITINLLTPIANNVWKIGQPNPIAWSAAADITGEIDLVNAQTKQFIGVILSNTGPNQTSYIWDARSIYRARYSADKYDVTPGTYSVRIHFDGNGLGDLVSGPITISN